jgi:hypothetical protein
MHKINLEAHLPYFDVWFEGSIIEVTYTKNIFISRGFTIDTKFVKDLAKLAVPTKPVD